MRTTRQLTALLVTAVVGAVSLGAADRDPHVLMISIDDTQIGTLVKAAQAGGMTDQT